MLYHFIISEVKSAFRNVQWSWYNRALAMWLEHYLIPSNVMQKEIFNVLNFAWCYI